MINNVDTERLIYPLRSNQPPQPAAPGMPQNARLPSKADIKQDLDFVDICPKKVIIFGFKALAIFFATPFLYIGLLGAALCNFTSKLDGARSLFAGLLFVGPGLQAMTFIGKGFGAIASFVYSRKVASVAFMILCGISAIGTVSLMLSKLKRRILVQLQPSQNPTCHQTEQIKNSMLYNPTSAN